MQGIKDLINSERSMFCLLVLAIATALTLAGKLTGTEWVSVVGTLITFLMAAKTVSHYIETKVSVAPGA